MTAVKPPSHLARFGARPYHRTFPYIIWCGYVCLHSEGGLILQPLKIGEVAPDFDLPCAVGEEKQQVRLSDFRGKKNVVLAFYALDWTPT